MNTINDYATIDLQDQIFNNLKTYTKSHIDARLQNVRDKLSHFPVKGPALPVSLGENCGVGIKIRELDMQPLGALFFDNLVCPLPSIIQLFQNDFRDMLQPGNLRIATWETHDSVFDDAYGIFYHHYFHLRPRRLEKSRIDPDGTRHRRIDEADIPLFLPLVSSQFHYLREKMRLILRAPLPKQLLVRKVGGEVIDPDMLFLLRQTLEDWGARNFTLRAICSTLPAHGQPPEAHTYIPEEGTRWGEARLWKVALSAAA